MYGGPKQKPGEPYTVREWNQGNGAARSPSLDAVSDHSTILNSCPAAGFLFG
jgi:hypothetical protein